MRPSTATCGKAARCSSSRIEPITASSTPFRMPRSSTPTSADHRDPELETAHAPEPRDLAQVDQPLHRDEHDRGQHRLRQVLEEAGQEEQADAERDGRDDQRQPRPGAGLLVHRRLREPAGHRVAVPERGQEVGAAEGEQLPAHVHVVAVLARERPRRRHALDVAEQQARRRERHDAVDVARPDARQADGRQAGRYRAHGGHPVLGEVEDGARDDRERHHGERHRPARQQPVSQEQQRERAGRHGEDDGVGVAQLVRQRSRRARGSGRRRRGRRGRSGAASRRC